MGLRTLAPWEAALQQNLGRCSEDGKCVTGSPDNVLALQPMRSFYLRSRRSSL